MKLNWKRCSLFHLLPVRNLEYVEDGVFSEMLAIEPDEIKRILGFISIDSIVLARTFQNFPITINENII